MRKGALFIVIFILIHCLNYNIFICFYLYVIYLQGLGGDVEEDVVVGCMTTDFAMQNVLKQMGLHIIGCNGRIIKVSKNIFIIGRRKQTKAFELIHYPTSP